MIMTQINIDGRTKDIRKNLKLHGWRWDSATQSWCRTIDEATASAIETGGTSMWRAIQSVGGWKKCCRICVAGREVWRDPGYTDYIDAALAKPSRGDRDNCDAAGNYVGGRKIPGSAPDDLI